MDKVGIYEITCEKEGIIKMFEKILQYGLVDIDVENSASLVDDMLKSNEDKLRYAIQKLEENNVDTARLVIKGWCGSAHSKNRGYNNNKSDNKRVQKTHWGV